MDQRTVENGTRRLLADIKTYLAGPGRWLVPHGFEVQAIQSSRKPNIFAPDLEALAENTTVVELRLPVIWEPEGIPARASETPVTDNLDELRDLLEFGLRTGDYWELRAASLEGWEPALPETAPRPSNIDWSVTATIVSS